MKKAWKSLIAVCCVVLLTVLAWSPEPVPASEQTEEASSEVQERGLDLTMLSDLLGSGIFGGGQSGGSSSGDGELSSTLENLTGLFDTLGLGSRAIKDCKFQKIPDKVYTGKAICPVPVITWQGKRLKKGQDYTVSYSDNTRVGTARCKVTGKGSYKGTKTLTFKIVGKNSGKARTGTSKKGSLKVSLTKTSYEYNGSYRKPSVKVSYSGKSLKAASYTVSYKNNKAVGLATVTVRGKGEYSGITGEAQFKITLKNLSVKAVSSPGAGTLKVTWNPDTQADGYEVQACTNQSFSSGTRKETVQGGKKKTWSFESLTGGKNYYVRIRSFKKVGKDNWFSTWSKAKQVKVK